MEGKDRVIFFPRQDVAYVGMLSKAEKILDDFNKNYTYTDINDIVELYHIKLYIDADSFLDGWSEKKRSSYKLIVKQFWTMIVNFANMIDNHSIAQYFDTIEWRYLEAFWQIMDKCKVYKHIPDDAFQSILTPKSIQDILKNENIVTHYNKVLREFLIEYEKSAEIVISKYEEKIGSRKTKIYLPISLSIEDKISILDKYADSVTANLNYLELILIAKNTNDFKIPDKIRLKVKKVIKTKTEEILSNNSFNISYQMGFVDEQVEPIISSCENDILKLLYSSSWIRCRFDTTSLFRNFKILFGMIDNQYRISLVSKKRNSLFSIYSGYNHEISIQVVRNSNQRTLLLLCKWSDILDFWKNTMFSLKMYYKTHSMNIVKL